MTQQPASRPPTQQNPKNSDDGVLDSLGKAIADPVKTGAEDEEPRDDGSAPVKPGDRPNQRSAQR